MARAPRCSGMFLVVGMAQANSLRSPLDSISSPIQAMDPNMWIVRFLLIIPRRVKKCQGLQTAYFVTSAFTWPQAVAG